MAGQASLWGRYMPIGLVDVVILVVTLVPLRGLNPGVVPAQVQTH
jgi:hypothetical protein